MIFIKTKYYPFGNYIAITHWPFVFHKKNISEKTKVHEKIHGKQQLELLIFGFYIMYIIEYLFKGYRNISFEREAYNNASNENYLKERKAFSFIKYL